MEPEFKYKCEQFNIQSTVPLNCGKSRNCWRVCDKRNVKNRDIVFPVKSFFAEKGKKTSVLVNTEQIISLDAIRKKRGGIARCYMLYEIVKAFSELPKEQRQDAIAIVPWEEVKNKENNNISITPRTANIIKKDPESNRQMGKYLTAAIMAFEGD